MRRLSWLLTVAAVIGGVSPLSSASAQAPRDWVAYYPFDGNHVDYGDKCGYTEVFGAAGWFTADRFGRPNRAAALTFGQQYLYVHDVSLGSNSLTVSAWINPSDGEASGCNTGGWTSSCSPIFTFAHFTPGNNQGAFGVHLWSGFCVDSAGDVTPSAGHLYANIVGEDGGSHPLSTANCDAPGPFTTGEYHHVALTYDKGADVGEAAIYLDGTRVAHMEAAAFAPLTGNAWLVGFFPLGGGFNASMDELLVYGRALSQPEIAAMNGPAVCR